jgi:hypothetical protein
MTKNEKEESVDVLKLKLKLLTVAVVLLVLWQVIDLLRVNSIADSVDKKAYEWDVDTLRDDWKNMDRNIQDIRDDIYDLKTDLRQYAKSSEVSEQIDNVYDYIRGMY